MTDTAEEKEDDRYIGAAPNMEAVLIVKAKLFGLRIFPASTSRTNECLLALFAELSSYPERCAAARESWLFQSEVHVALYSLSPRSSVYRILFTIQEANGDPATVYILSVRHGARKPMTRAEAREVEKDE